MVIYKITNSINNKIYIGQSNEFCKYYRCGGKLIKMAIRKYGWINFKREIIVRGDFNKESLDELEKYYIKLYNSNDLSIGYNLTIGGNSSGTTLKGTNIPEERKQRISNSLKGFKRPEFTKEHRKNISLSQKDRIISDVTKLKMAEGQKLRIHTKEENFKIAISNSVAILQYDLNNNFIKEWIGASFAARELKLSQGNISSCCKGKRNKCGNFIWKFKDVQ